MSVTHALYNSSCWSGREKALHWALGLCWQTRSITIHLVLNKGIRGSAHRESIIHREAPICNTSLVHFYYSPHFNITASTRRPVGLRTDPDLICPSAFCDLCPVLSGGHILRLALNSSLRNHLSSSVGTVSTPSLPLLLFLVKVNVIYSHSHLRCKFLAFRVGWYTCSRRLKSPAYSSRLRKSMF